MGSEREPNQKVEIAHVLSIDLVGYSLLLITEQTRVMSELARVVKNTKQFRRADAQGKLARIPTGDGMSLVFFDDPQAPIECATEIASALKSHPDIRLRMGIHSGPVNEVIDVSDRSNVAGAGMDMAQRVMDCGDAGHILLSRRVAEDLAPFPRWHPHLHELGECEVKHGRKVSLVNFYTDEIGNPNLPNKRRVQLPVKSAWSRYRVIAGSVLLLMVVLIALVKFWRFSPEGIQANTKSIAVLPFENLSRDPENAYFADGVQGEILSRLSRIADLKVISRTSTQRYKSAPPNLAEIAKQLGVAHILEGTIQRAGNQVRVNVQLINAQNDSHLWADKYDRKLSDIFGVETEIAAKIAATLQAKLTGAEEHAIATRPTADMEAYQSYLKGIFFSNKRTGPDLGTAIGYFNQATAKDPNYALADAGLADAYVFLSLYGAESPQQAVPAAKAAAKSALEIDNSLAEAHNSLGLLLSFYEFDFPQSKKEFERAIELDPNSATAHQQFGNTNLIMVGDFNRAIAEGKRAVELNPLSLVINTDLAQNLMLARRYDEAIEQLRKTIEIEPRFYYARWALGGALQLQNRLSEAMAEYKKAAELSNDPLVTAWIAQGYARTGQREEALKLLSQLEQLATKQYVGPVSLALVHLALGEKEKAIDNLERAYRERSDPYIVAIKVWPIFDPLRGDPRFEQLVKKIFRDSESDATTRAVEEEPVAVLSFENLSRDPDNAYFTEGIMNKFSLVWRRSQTSKASRALRLDATKAYRIICVKRLRHAASEADRTQAFSILRECLARFVALMPPRMIRLKH